MQPVLTRLLMFGRGGWKIMFDRQSDWKKQLQVLETILKEKIKDRTNLKYIDVRFENRSYFQ